MNNHMIFVFWKCQIELKKNLGETYAAFCLKFVRYILRKGSTKQWHGAHCYGSLFCKAGNDHLNAWN